MPDSIAADKMSKVLSELYSIGNGDTSMAARDVQVHYLLRIDEPRLKHGYRWYGCRTLRITRALKKHGIENELLNYCTKACRIFQCTLYKEASDNRNVQRHHHILNQFQVRAGKGVPTKALKTVLSANSWIARQR